MTTSFDALGIRRRLGIRSWEAPRPFGPDGWAYEHIGETGRVIITCSDLPDEADDWVHASICFRDRDPEYVELALLHRAVWPEGWAYQVFAPPVHHINIHEHALHLWGRLDNSAALTAFSQMPSI